MSLDDLVLSLRSNDNRSRTCCCEAFLSHPPMERV